MFNTPVNLTEKEIGLSQGIMELISLWQTKSGISPDTGFSIISLYYSNSAHFDSKVTDNEYLQFVFVF